MTLNEVRSKDNKYYFNNNQYFLVDKTKGKELLNEIKFPVLIMDTEFFNKSHDMKHKPDPIYSEQDPDMIYTVCYSIAKSFKDLDNRENRKSISTLTIRRKKKERFNFIEERDKLLKELFNVIIKKKIRTLVFAGEANDVRILQNWIKNNKQILNNKECPLISKDKEGKLVINSFDMYNALTQAFSFSNKNADGSEYYNPKNLKKGNLGEDTIQIPSLEKFFDYLPDTVVDDDFREEKDIYQLCVWALELYSEKELTNKENIHLSMTIKRVKKHCRNDVLKLLYVTDFIYHFILLSDDKNDFIKK